MGSWWVTAAWNWFLKRGTMGEFRCLLCDYVLEVFDGATEVALRLTVQPERQFE
jgi:hypothetical protein